MSRWSARGSVYQAKAAAFLAVYTVCWICGHGGADSIDHVFPVSLFPHLRMVTSLWRPAHGVNGCPQCPPNRSRDKRRNGQPRRCNQERQAKLGSPQSRQSRAW